MPGKRSVHQAIDGAPHVTTSGSVVARSHHGASMPPAIHEQLPSPSALATLDDLDGHATLGKLESAGEAGNAGANDNDGGLGQSITPVPSPA